MLITALQNFTGRGYKAFHTGEDYDILDSDAKQFVRRGLAEPKPIKKKEKSKPRTSAKVE